jgi:hypothetical protein
VEGISQLRRTSSQRADSFHPDDGGDKFLRNVSSYKNHTVHIPEDGILHSHRLENLKSYIVLTGWTL